MKYTSLKAKLIMLGWEPGYNHTIKSPISFKPGYSLYSVGNSKLSFTSIYSHKSVPTYRNLLNKGYEYKAVLNIIMEHSK